MCKQPITEWKGIKLRTTHASNWLKGINECSRAQSLLLIKAFELEDLDATTLQLDKKWIISNAAWESSKEMFANNSFHNCMFPQLWNGKISYLGDLDQKHYVFLQPGTYYLINGVFIHEKVVWEERPPEEGDESVA